MGLRRGPLRFRWHRNNRKRDEQFVNVRRRSGSFRFTVERQFGGTQRRSLEFGSDEWLGPIARRQQFGRDSD